MKQVIIYKSTNKQPNKPIMAGYCESFFCRLRGLTFRRSIAKDEGLLLVNPKESRMDAAIHMVSVFFQLGIVWVNTDLIVVDKALAKPWISFLMPQDSAKYILEIHPSRLSDFQIGEQLYFEIQ